MKPYQTAALLILASLTACNTATPPQLAASDLQASLASAGDKDPVKQFYARAGWQAAWSKEDAKALDEALAGRARHGLDHVSFYKDPGPDASPAERDVARTRAALAYAGALARGYADPRALHKIYTVPRPAPDLVAGLAEALDSGDIGEWLDGLAPQDGDYRALSQAYLGFQEEVRSQGGQPRIPAAGGTIHVGESDPRVPLVASQLVANGYLEKRDGASQVYDRAMEAAVRQFQRDYGIADDGTIGPATLEPLNMGPAALARMTALALERLRWLERDPPATRIDVNIAAAQLSYWRDGKPVDHRKVIVGRPDKETPLLQAPLFRLVANPTWTVPRSIQTTELAGKSDDYLAARNMSWRDGWIVQGSGPDNALGEVKFDMRDDYAIYLHDTNARSLFSRSQRQLSHGCVRVQDALGFAEMIARQEGVLDAWGRARRTGEEQFVPLPDAIPVRLLYQTAFIDADGQVQARTDPYGWDDALAAKLGLGQRANARFRTDTDDIGP